MSTLISVADSDVSSPAHAARPSPEGARLRLLGSFRLDVDGDVLAVPRGGQRLLALLCLHGRSGRRRVSGLLWPETTTAQALTNLRHVLWRLQRLSTRPLVLGQGSDVLLEPSVSSDVAGLLHESWPVLERRAPSACTDLLRADAADLLADWDDEWLVADRERLRQLRLHLLEQWADLLAEQGRYGLAMEAALAALRTDDLRESAHRAVIRVHLAEGNLSEARRAFMLCRRVLRSQVGVDPSPQTRELVSTAGSAAVLQRWRSLR
jgi:DNA-binding SARP family transcriptional activator